MPAWLKIALDKIIDGAVTAGGLPGWAAKKLLQFGGQALYDNAVVYWQRFVRWLKDLKAKKEMEKITEDPNKPSEEKGEAYEDFINSDN